MGARLSWSANEHGEWTSRQREFLRRTDVERLAALAELELRQDNPNTVDSWRLLIRPKRNPSQ